MSAPRSHSRPRRKAAQPRTPPPVKPAMALEGVEETVWIEVIRKMDEVYSDLLQYEVALEEKNAALEESQKFIYSVLTSMSDVLLVCNRTGRVEEVNQALLDLVGETEDRLKGRAVAELFSDEASRMRFSKVIAQNSSEPMQDCEVQIRCRGGGSVPVALNCTPRYNGVGKYVGLVLTGRPVGELRRAYDALRQAHEDLKRAQQQLVQSEKLASLGLLVAGVAHELNNPISFVLGNVHALRKYAERIQAYLDAVHAGRSGAELEELRRKLRIDRLLDDLRPLIEGTVEGAERTRDIVEGLRRFSAADRNESTVFVLNDIIERAVHWVTRAASSRVRVAVDLPPQMRVSGSVGQMQQVIVNLVQNAIDAVGRAEGARLEICGAIEDGEVRVAFRDSGPGIADEHLARVFDPFFTTKPVGKGTGLGLSVSYGIVERHGGRLTAANHPQGGAVFTLVLPLAPA